MKTLKAYVKNFARPEACMAEGYLAGECLAFCMEFLQKSVPVEETITRNEDVETMQNVLEGRALQKATEVILSDKERYSSPLCPHEYCSDRALCSVSSNVIVVIYLCYF